MGSEYKIQADSIDQEARDKIADDPELAKRIDKMLPYLSLEMLLKSSYLSVNQMVIAAGSTFGIRSKIEELINEYLDKDLIEITDVDDGSEEKFYRIADKEKAESLFVEIASNRK